MLVDLQINRLLPTCVDPSHSMIVLIQKLHIYEGRLEKQAFNNTECL